MQTILSCPLPSRSLIFLRGNDRFDFLQPLISNDLQPVAEGKIIWAAQLTPQGKFAYDLLIGAFEDVIIIEVATQKQAAFMEALQGFKLSLDVEFAIGADFKVWVTDSPAGGLKFHGYGLHFPDPRAGDSASPMFSRFWGRDEDWQILQKTHAIELTDDNIYHARRIQSFVPENSQTAHDDLLYGKTLLLEAGFDSLGGIDWHKGCYVGQELTARTKYRGLVKKCLVAVTAEVPFGDNTICDEGGEVVGDLRSRAATDDGQYIALAGMRLGDLQKPLFCGEQRLNLHVPPFLHTTSQP